TIWQEGMENALTGNQSSHASLGNVHSINPTQLMARIESYEGRENKGISDVRRTFCLFVTFDLLFVTLLWIMELNVNGVFRFKALILAYAVCRLRHWWAILFSQGAFGYVLPIISFILAWIETWVLDFKVLPQEAAEENRLLIVQDASERAALIPGGFSDGQFYSAPESEIGSEEGEEKQDSEKPLLEL
uniref:MENTAL domain-containing protein n=1 Tax=Colobus angolensis palliatus TaxID=336983 RepID=A0A2K5HL40_COLAP